jgi:two-component system CheB/CheR fusion protein
VDGAFRLEAASQAGIPKPSIDEFFASLAIAFEVQAIGVVLSGTGSDGARGVRAIHAAGGCTLAQDPAEAKYDGMPRAAIESGCVDFVVKVEDLAGQLARLLKVGGEAALSDDGDRSVPAIDRIVSTVKRRAGFDLGLYKPRSLERRIRRRVVATESASMDAYAELLQNSAQEVERVVREMFISVTQFFRDGDAFNALDRELGKILAEKPESEELRIWVPGCATGEEAYSLAMLVAEHFERMQRWPVVRLFATDLDTAALAKARRGVFSGVALSEVPGDLAKKYLSGTGESFQIAKRLREMVIFSEHNILHDPAFLRLDLISCRNLLIYLQPEVQHRVLTTFAHALKGTGLLFLGKAEGLYANTDLFSVVDAAGHLYKSRGTVGWQSVARMRQTTVGMGPRPQAHRRAAESFDLGAWLTRAHADGALSPFVMVDDDGQLLHAFGDVTPYLKLGAGPATLDVLQLAIEPIRLELRSTLLHVQRKTNQRVCTDILLDDGARRVQLVAIRREEVNAPPLTLVMFEPRAPMLRSADGAEGVSEPAGLRAALEEQLTATRDHLSTVISELESTNEELQSLNEEMQSANEELQSANEELETSNEELQSTNEELITVNEELESRTAELSLEPVRNFVCEA